MPGIKLDIHHLMMMIKKIVTTNSTQKCQVVSVAVNLAFKTQLEDYPKIADHFD